MPDADSTHAPLPDRPWIHALALLAIALTFILIAIGGNVTSLGAGMAFPEGWTTSGYWSLIAPVETWAQEPHKFWEHVHRLVGYLVGIVFIALVAGLWLREHWLAKRRGERRRTWLASVATLALLLVIVQGVLGATRVDLNSTALAFIHGINGQLILALTVLIAAATSRPWLAVARDPAQRDRRLGRGARLAGWGLLAVLVLQLIMGAAVRHTNATLAIPDFPTSYGGVVPPMSKSAIETVAGGYSVMQVHVHFTHRVLAAVVGVWALAVVIALGMKAPGRRELVGPRLWLVALLFAQIALGAMVIWRKGATDLTTAHQATGAAMLAVAMWLALRIHLVSGPGRR
jgi:cytochrome c oxidase assembly protein subunit 15